MATAIERRLDALERRLQARRSAGFVWRPEIESAEALINFFIDRPPLPTGRQTFFVCPTIPTSVWMTLAQHWPVEGRLPDTISLSARQAVHRIPEKPRPDATATIGKPTGHT
jgi:hypothetical protein